MERSNLTKVLARYVPAGTEELLTDWIINLKIQVRITRARGSKLGDYRPPQQGHGHRISVNHNLNQYAFLITLVHEIAHLTTWNRFQNKVNPHGTEWKHEFRQLMMPFLQGTTFPPEVKHALIQYLHNPAASSCSDPKLQKVLAQYNEHPIIHLDDLPNGALFSVGNGMTFKKGEKKRTRYLCQEVQTGRFYMVSGVAEVELIG